MARPAFRFLHHAGKALAPSLVCGLLLVLLGLFRAQPGWAEVLRIASTDWPPYSNPREPEGGTSLALIKRAFMAAGISLAVDFLPWERAVLSGTAGAGYIGYAPEYYDRRLDVERAGNRCLYSSPFQRGPLGVVMRRDSPVRWDKLADLGIYRIGVVAGYLNTPAFDRLAASGAIPIERAPDDLTNVRKVALRRLPAAIIDANVLGYLLGTQADLADFRDTLVMAEPLLAQKALYVCFRADTAGRAARDSFNRGLASLGDELSPGLAGAAN
jgi:polar amino acid transport system substrate-binding protein